MTYRKAQAFRLPKIEGQLALINFLDALLPLLAPKQAQIMRQQISMQAALRQDKITINNHTKVFTFALQEQLITRSKRKSSAVYATFRGELKEPLKNKG